MKKYLFPILFVLFLSCCAFFYFKQRTIINSNSKFSQSNASTDLNSIKVSSSISCTKNDLTSADSTLYMNGGGKDFLETKPNLIKSNKNVPKGMVLISGGEFSMGGVNPVGMNDGGHERMNDSRPVHSVYLNAFYMDEHEVTNAQFAAFVKATGYITVAEIKPTHEEFPDALEENLVAGAVVFSPPRHKVALDNFYVWWNYLPGANWKNPLGETSSINGCCSLC
jgi:formylglycine-generating enzyme